MVETAKGDQRAVMSQLYEEVEEILKSESFGKTLFPKIKKRMTVSLIRTFTESSLAEAVLKTE